MVNRQDPHDLEAERSLLGAMLVNKDTCKDVLTKAVEDDFYDDSHRLIFRAMKETDNQGLAVDVITVTSYLKDHSQLDKAKGVEYLLTLSESVPTVAHSPYYLKIVQDKAMLRRIIKQATMIAEGAYGDVDDLDDFINDSEKGFLEVTHDRNSGEFKNIRDVIDEVTKRLNKLQTFGGKISGVRTKFTDLDNMTSGWQKSDLIILAARPSVGKTAFALNMAYNAALDSDLPVAIFSLEMNADQLVQRMICSAGSIEGSQIRTGEILKTNANKYFAAIDQVSRCNLFIDDSAGIRINDIVSKCRKLQQEHGEIKLIVIDYLQLIVGSSNNRESRQQEVSDISRQLKSLARELNVPVIALSQLSRSVEQRTDKRPMLSDLRESGAIEQDADIVAFIHREDYQKDPEQAKEDGTQGITEIIIAKHRNGPIGDVQLAFEAKYSRFANLSKQGVSDVGVGVRDART